MVDLSRVLIIGSEGKIGKELDFGIKVGHSELDVNDIESVKKLIKKHNPSAVLNLASLNIKNCEEQPFLANKVNVEGTYNLAVETDKLEIPLILISTGAIFNGSAKGEFSETDSPNPQNIYGQTKYFAELIARKYNSRSIIIRTGWLFGFSKSQNFFDKIINSAKLGREIIATDDQYGSFTYFPDFKDSLKKAISSGDEGIYHLVNSGKASALDLVKIILVKTQSKSAIKIVSIDNIEPGIKRSKSEALISKKFKLRSWQEALNDYFTYSS